MWRTNYCRCVDYIACADLSTPLSPLPPLFNVEQPRALRVLTSASSLWRQELVEHVEAFVKHAAASTPEHQAEAAQQKSTLVEMRNFIGADRIVCVVDSQGQTYVRGVPPFVTIFCARCMLLKRACCLPATSLHANIFPFRCC